MSSIPYGSNIENVEKLVREVSNGERRKSQLYGSEKPFSKYTFFRTVDLAEELGFVESDSSVVYLRDEGRSLLKSEVSKVVRDGLKDSNLYSDLLRSMRDRSAHADKRTYHTEEIVNLMKSTSGADLNKRSMKNAATLFMKLLDLAGYGEYIKRRGKSSVFKLDELPELESQQLSFPTSQQKLIKNQVSSAEKSKESAEDEKEVQTFDISYSRRRDEVTIEIENLSKKEVSQLVAKIEELTEY